MICVLHELYVVGFSDYDGTIRQQNTDAFKTLISPSPHFSLAPYPSLRYTRNRPSYTLVIERVPDVGGHA
ncbi:hypothetical protein SCLCIDRAFT_1209682 [Scleroderma citrinum Foug A]|uniref:Uncharacterized protein n=1 Tax=Scleroderma citrinum Foug A TaxID=1036808 RepID=A0A0C3EK28_9AGAM|nr:hypothetical protein SCLCIDRAFT_1209682 [Scleroderma citrinum Foug A]